jgi:hypothetical protein
MLSANSVIGQKRTNELKFLVNMEFPLGNFANHFEIGYSGGASDYIWLTKNNGIILSCVFAQWQSKTNLVDSDHVGNMTLIDAGYWFLINRKLYFQIAPGIAIYDNLLGGRTKFHLSSSVGYLIYFGESRHGIDFSTKINFTVGSPGYTWISAGVGYILDMSGATERKKRKTNLNKK